jgi:hypothetical protein
MSEPSKNSAEAPRIYVEWQKPAPPPPTNDLGAVMWNLMVIAIAMSVFVVLLNDQEKRRMEYESLSSPPVSPSRVMPRDRWR